MKKTTNQTMLKRTAAVLAAACVCAALPVSAAEYRAATAQDAAETVSRDCIAEAMSIGILENQEGNWSEAITREQFCNLIYNMVNKAKELPMAKLARSPFDDTDNPKVNALQFVGIISGKAERIFAPDEKLSREEAAVILVRCADYVGLELPMVRVDMSYSDNSEISPWAVSSVYRLKVPGILEDRDGAFAPQAALTGEEALSMLIKFHSMIPSESK